MTSTLDQALPTAQASTGAAGILDLLPDGRGILRTGDLLPGPRDVRVPAALVRSAGLRRGDAVTGRCDRPGTLTRVDRAAGLASERLAGRPDFADLTPVHPHRRLRLETPGVLTGRVLDLVAPIGRGQRGLIVAPPKTGKTVLLQQVAAAVAANHPDARLLVLLVDERPEEVTDMRRSVRGQVIGSTFDRPASQHIAVAELVVEHAKRCVERGEDVVLLLDSLTRLCRAYNNAARAGGRTLSGGVDATALAGPKRLFGAARQTEEAGSLTILATALVDTGSRADDLFFEELKSTGTMEVRLDRAAADRRAYPAVDLSASGTRRSELLVAEPEFSAVVGLRRALLAGPAGGALDTLLGGLAGSADNAAFLRRIQGSAAGPGARSA